MILGGASAAILQGLSIGSTALLVAVLAALALEVAQSRFLAQSASATVRSVAIASEADHPLIRGFGSLANLVTMIDDRRHSLESGTSAEFAERIGQVDRFYRGVAAPLAKDLTSIYNRALELPIDSLPFIGFSDQEPLVTLFAFLRSVATLEQIIIERRRDLTH